MISSCHTKSYDPKIVGFSHDISCENPVFVRSVLGFSRIFRFDNLHICDIELIRSIYAVIKMFTRIETGTVQVL